MSEPLTIKIAINPEIGHIGGLVLAWHGLFIALGIAAGVYVAVLMARRKGFIQEDAFAVAIAAVVGGIIGARALFAAENWGQIGGFGGVLSVNQGGISVYGGIIGGIIAGGTYGLWKRMPVWKGLDAGAVGMILGQPIGRIGCVINGEHVGSPSHLPWAIQYTNVNSPSFGLGSLQPAAGYEMIGDFLLFGLLLLLSRVAKKDGVVFGAYALLYAVLRFGVSFLRLDNEPALGLRLAQLIALGFVAGSVLLFAYLWRAAGGTRVRSGSVLTEGGSRNRNE
ncbi:MAG: prolipoprotein diacylglyceryl transferase family protein [Dehalococcoidia bacterium]|jgi:phosphatidylglycerol:prolipoprotein diacylglycerol transferase